MWQIVTSGAAFVAPLHERRLAICDRYDQIPTPSEQERLDAEIKELDELQDRIEAFIASGADPTTVLAKAYQPNLGPVIPNHYVLHVGDWQAYFRVDVANRRAKGVYLCRTTDPPALQIKSVLDNIP
jgi:hypothetical protein